MKKLIENNSEYFYLVFRVIIGLVFFLHGLMKVQWMLDGKLQLVSLMGLAMVIEIIGGILLILGLFTRITATISAIEMVVAWFNVHIAKGWDPLSNGGEPALLFFAIFLVLIAYGAGKYSLDGKIKNR